MEENLFDNKPQKAEEQKIKPDFSGNGVGVWINRSQKTGQQYLTIKIVGHNIIYAWLNKEDP